MKQCAEPYPVQIGLRVLGEVKVDHNIDSLDINAASEQICRKYACQAEHVVCAKSKHNASEVNKEEALTLGAYLKTLDFCSCHCESHERLCSCGFGASWHECKNMNTQVL